MIIGVVNNKGGVLKTTMSTNIGSYLSSMGKKVIIVDLDGQGNVAATFGINPFNLNRTIIDFLKNSSTLEEIIVRQRENLDLLLCNDELNYFDIFVNNREIEIGSLKNLITKLNEIYDFVIVDTPPNMSTIVAIILSITNVVLIPFEPDQYAVLGLKRIIDAAKQFIEKSNKDMKIIAIPTKVNTRVTIHNEIIEQSIKPKLLMQNVYLTKNYISSSTKSTASVGYEKVPIVFSIIKSKYQDEYKFLTEEILDHLGVFYGK